VDLSEISFGKLTAQVRAGLQAMYNKAGSVFSAASPFGHLLAVVEELFRLNVLHTKNIVRGYDITDPANGGNTRVIRGLAVLGGHNPSRAVSASGTLQLQLKPGLTPAAVPGGSITLYNRSLVRNSSNGLMYSLDLGAEKQSFQVTAGGSVYVAVVQGEWHEYAATGQGVGSQTFNVSAPSGQDVDNYRFDVYVNSDRWEPRNSTLDMLPEQTAYTCKTGISGGLDVGFGNDYFGQAPPLASEVLVRYLMTDGAQGNIPNPALNEFQFVDEVFDANGGAVSVEDTFDVSVATPIQFGADGESADFTRSMLPFVSTNFVLARPENFIFHLRRLGIFSVVDAYVPTVANGGSIESLVEFAKLGSDLVASAAAAGTLADKRVQSLLTRHTSSMERTIALLAAQANSSVINLFLLPNVRNYYGDDPDFDYFTVPMDAFTLDDVEKARVLTYLTIGGATSLVADVRIADPVVKRYAVTVMVLLYEEASLEDVQADVRRALSDYFIDNDRRDRIPRSDVTRMVEDVYGVDSADVVFVSEETERYHTAYGVLNEAFQVANGRVPADGEVKMADGTAYDPFYVSGLDPDLGDILLGEQDFALLRGGWADRDGRTYSEFPQAAGFGPLNLVVVPAQTSRARAMAQTRPALSTLKPGATTVVASPVANINKGYNV
jgi:hypothetical protein